MLVLLTASPAVVTMSNAPYIIAAMQQLRRESHSFVDRELVQVAQSSRHGLGLFAALDVLAGTVMSFYPVDSIGMDVVASGLVETCASLHDMTGISQTNASHRLYLPHCECGGMCIDANPQRPGVDGWLAHLINDGAVCRSESHADVVAYLEASEDAENVVLAPFGAAPLVACVAVRDIAAGDELLTTYGPAFWVGHRLQGAIGKVVARRREIRLTEFEHTVLKTSRREQAAEACSLKLVEALGWVAAQDVAGTEEGGLELEMSN